MLKMSMLAKVLISVGVVLGGFFAYVGTRPSEMYVAREITVNATPEAVFPFINNSKKADAWMPWKDSDPGVQMTYVGPEEGVGSKSTWDSKGQMGTGEALVVASVPNQSVKTQLTYTKPFTMSQMAEISLSPETSGTKVRWSVSGQSNFFFKLMGVFKDCDSMIGPEFEKGLSRLKSQVEAQKSVK